MSLRAKVTLAFTAMLAVVLVATGIFLYLRFAADLRAAADRGLWARAAQFAAAVRGGEVAGELAGVRGVEADEEVAQVLGPDGAVLAWSPLARRPLLSRAQLAAARSGPRFVDRPGNGGRLDDDLRLLAAPVPGARAVAVVGVSRDEVTEGTSTLAALEVVGLGAALIVGAGGAWLLAGAVVRPVHAALARERSLVADAGHELRTPLAILRAELEVTRMEGAGEDELRAALASATEEVDRLSRLADDLLVLARADEHGVPLSPVDVDLDTVLERAARGFAGVEVRPSGLRVHGDELRLEQAVRNLIDNAARHGAPPVHVEARQADDGVVIGVRDHGDGLAPGFADRAFERFSRADTRRPTPGAGLGLPIVAAIAAAHGGTVRLVPAKPGMKAELTVPHRSLSGARAL